MTKKTGLRTHAHTIFHILYILGVNSPGIPPGVDQKIKTCFSGVTHRVLSIEPTFDV